MKYPGVMTNAEIVAQEIRQQFYKETSEILEKERKELSELMTQVDALRTLISAREIILKSAVRL